MRRVRFIGCVLPAALGLWPLSAGAAKNELHNKITAYLQPGASAREAVVAVWMSNVNPVIGITLPFKFAAGETDSIVLDSLLTSTGRAAGFKTSPPQYKRENQTLLVVTAAIADSVASKLMEIPAGQGLLAVIFLHAKSDFPMIAFKMAAVELPPENVLMYVTDTFNSVQPDFELVRKAPPAWSPKKSAAPKGRK